MATLAGQTVKDTYQRVLQCPNADGVNATLTAIEDGEGTASALRLALSQVVARPAANHAATFAVQQDDGTDVLVVDTASPRVILAALQVSGLGAGVVRADVSGNLSSAALAPGDLPEINDTVHGNRGGGSLHAAATSGTDGFMPAADKAKIDLYPAVSALTPGHVLRATGATSAAFGALQLSDLPALTASDVGAAAETHAATHASGGSDPLAPGDIGAATDTDAAVGSSAVGAVALTLEGTAGQTAPVLEIYESTGGAKVAQLLPDGTLEVLRVKIVETFS